MVGIDIGSHTIKIVEVERAGNGYTLVSSGVVAVQNVDIDKFTSDKEYAALGDIIRKLHKQAGITNKDVVVSIPETQAFTRTIHFPLLTDAEIASAVKWEAEQFIPIPIQEAVVQHTILERNEKSTPPEVIVLLIAAPKAIIEKYVKVVQAAGLTAMAVETELVALSRALAPIDRTCMIVDLGATSTDIGIAKNGNLSFSRSIPIGGLAFTRAITQGLGVSSTQAEEYKKTYGVAKNELEGKIKTALDPVLTMVTDEIKKATHFYQTEEKGEAPKELIVTGGTSGMPDIISFLTETLGIEVVVANPFKKITLQPETAKKLAAYAPLYSVSVGLALREV